MLLAEADEQIIGTRGHHVHGNVEALLSGKTLKAANKKILIGEKEEQLASEGVLDELFKQGRSQVAVYLFFPARHQHVIKGSD